MFHRQIVWVSQSCCLEFDTFHIKFALNLAAMRNNDELQRSNLTHGQSIEHVKALFSPPVDI